VKECISIVAASAEIRRRRITVAIANIQLLKKEKVLDSTHFQKSQRTWFFLCFAPKINFEAVRFHDMSCISDVSLLVEQYRTLSVTLLYTKVDGVGIKQLLLVA